MEIFNFTGFVLLFIVFTGVIGVVAFISTLCLYIARRELVISGPGSSFRAERLVYTYHLIHPEGLPSWLSDKTLYYDRLEFVRCVHLRIPLPSHLAYLKPVAVILLSMQISNLLGAHTRTSLEGVTPSKCVRHLLLASIGYRSACMIQVVNRGALFEEFILRITVYMLGPEYGELLEFIFANHISENPALHAYFTSLIAEVLHFTVVESFCSRYGFTCIYYNNSLLLLSKHSRSHTGRLVSLLVREIQHSTNLMSVLLPYRRSFVFGNCLVSVSSSGVRVRPVRR